jgi:hypothetical protein
MDAGQVIAEPPRTPPEGKSQPIEAIAKPEPLLDDAAVRQAIANAEVNNQDPQTITLDEFAQGSVQNPTAQVQSPKPVEVPQKFLKPDGTVDVEKIQTSTKHLDEAIQTREPIPQKTVDDYMREYQEKEKLFRSGTVPKAAAPEPQPVPSAPPLPEPNHFEDIVRRDFAMDQVGTMTRLLDLMVQQKFQPIEEKERAEKTRQNLQALASTDPRILREDIFAAVNAKLRDEPELWKLKNPHRKAFLEVKEEMRLGDPIPGQAQPSRLPSPVLGGGSPPSVPSASVPSPSFANTNLDALDLRDKKQEALGDEAIRRALMGNRG